MLLQLSEAKISSSVLLYVSPVVGVGVGEAFYSPMTRSLSFREPVTVNFDLHNCFSVILAQKVRWEGYRELELGVSLPFPS